MRVAIPDFSMNLLKVGAVMLDCLTLVSLWFPITNLDTSKPGLLAFGEVSLLVPSQQGFAVLDENEFGVHEINYSRITLFGKSRVGTARTAMS